MKNLARTADKLYVQNWLVRPETLETFARQFEAHTSGQNAGFFDDDEDEENDDDLSQVRISGKTMIIPVHGVLGKHLSNFEMMCGGCSVDALSKQIQNLEKDYRVENAIMDFRTPGGQVVGTPELAKVISECNKEIFGFFDFECCSGGMWLASQCSALYCTESAMCGSVGVYSIYLDRTKQLAENGIKVNAISSGEYKLTGSPFRVMSDDERAMLQAQSDSIHEKFKAAMAARKIPDEYLQGQVFLGDEAAKLGFVDGLVDDLDEVVAMLQ